MNILIILFSAITISLLVLSIPLLTYSGFVAKELAKQKHNSRRPRG